MDLIDSDDLWNNLLPNAEKQQKQKSAHSMTSEEASYIIFTWLQQNPKIKFTVQ
jgi:hypothetical protein